MKRHVQRQHALSLIYMHLIHKESFDTLVESLADVARIERINVLIEDKDGQPVPHINLRLNALYSDKSYRAKSNKDGVSAFKNVLKGVYRLETAELESESVFHRPVFGVNQAVLMPVNKDEQPDVKKIKKTINQIENKPYIVEIDTLLDETKTIQIHVQTFMPYRELNDDFMNVLYRIEERFDIYKRVIDATLNESWRFDRLGLIEQSILLLACAELEFGDVPKTIIVNEAVELAKEYSDETSYKLINGVLDTL